jgi:membrane fusion protein (multidrug efflux system)
LRGGSKRFGRRAILFLAAGLLVLVTATYWFISTAAYETTDDATVEAHVIQVSPKVSAHVKTVHFDDNYQVKRGELLVELDPRDYDVALASAVANLASLRSKLTESQAQQNVAQAGLGLFC